MVSTPAHGTPLPVSSLSLTDKAAAVTTLEPCVPTQQSTTTHTRGVQTADHLDSALSNFTPSPPPENCVLPSATRTQRFQCLPSASNMSGSVGALVQASWDSPTSSPPSSSYSAASSPGREEIPPNVRVPHDDRGTHVASSISRDLPNANTNPRSHLSSSPPHSSQAMRSDIMSGFSSSCTSIFLLLLIV